MRYAWHMREAYFGDKPRGIRARLRDSLLRRLRDWDRRTANRVTHFIAISKTVQERIRECYGRTSAVIYPPVDTDFYCPDGGPRDDYYLVVSAFAPYKRLDLAVEACRLLGRRLVVIGAGQDAARLRAMANGSASFLGWQPDSVIRDHLRRCRALLFPGEEDFGIVPVEANACGTPVIAFGRGGATETIVPLGAGSAPTGVWFDEQTVEALANAIEHLERNADRFSPGAIRRQALRFTTARFAEQLFGFLDEVMGRGRVLRAAA
jgi:glycosyltransferase involved in cell wall biosynthesis